MQKKKTGKKKIGLGYVIGSIVVAITAMAVMPAIINGLADEITRKTKFPIPEDDTLDAEEKDEEETKHGEL